MKRLLAFFTVFCMASPSATAETFYRDASIFSSPHPAVARIVAPEREGASYGSGTLVAVNESSGLVLTNWHVVRDAGGPIVVYFPNGFRSGAYLLRTDQDWDLAALAIRRPNVQPVSIATQKPQPGDEVTIAGYGSGSYRAVTGRVTQYVSPGGNHPYEMLELSAPARNGDSGGPIFNSRGELAGTLFGSSFGRTAGSYCGRLRWFVANVDNDFRRISEQALLAQRAQQGLPLANSGLMVGQAEAPSAEAATYPATNSVPTASPPCLAVSQSNPSPAAVDPYAAQATQPTDRAEGQAATPTTRAVLPPPPEPMQICSNKPSVLAKVAPSATEETRKVANGSPSVAPSLVPVVATPVAAIPASPQAVLQQSDPLKSILALIGALAVLYHAIRFLGWAVG